MNTLALPTDNVLNHVDPNITIMLNEVGVIYGILCIFFGILLLLLWVPMGSSENQKAKKRVRLGYGLIGLGIGFLFFGFYLSVIVLLLIVSAIGYVLIKGIKIAL